MRTSESFARQIANTSLTCLRGPRYGSMANEFQTQTHNVLINSLERNAK
jgi:hypothetical protein